MWLVDWLMGPRDVTSRWLMGPRDVAIVDG